MKPPLQIVIVLRRVVPSTTIGLLIPFEHMQNAQWLAYDLCSDLSCPVALIEQSDLVIIHRGLYPETYRVMQLAHALGKPVLYDVDDYFLGIPEDHPLGSWLHRQDIRRSIEAMQAEANCIKAGSLYLADKLSPVNSSVICHPFAVDTSLFAHNTPLESTPHLRIGYCSSRHHTPDINEIYTAVVDGVHRNGMAATFEIRGPAYPEGKVSELLTIRRFPFINSYTKYASQLANSDWTIGLAPIRNTPYNAAKSDVKFRDYAAAGIPAIYSDSPPYQAVLPYITGLLARTQQEWTKSVAELLHDGALRRSIASAARLYVEEHHSPAQICRLWLQLFKRMVPGWTTA